MLQFNSNLNKEVIYEQIIINCYCRINPDDDSRA